MDEFIKSIEKAMSNKNYIAAITMAIIIPDICGQIEFNNKHYKKWFEAYMPATYNDHITGSDAFAMRCAFLHSFSGRLTAQNAHDKLDQYEFRYNGSHLISVRNHNSDDISRCVVSARHMSEDLINSYKSWKENIVVQSEELLAKFSESETNMLKFNNGSEIAPGIYVE